MINSFLTALRFLTIIPLGDSRKSTELSKAMPFFPAVGFLIGLASLAVFSIAEKFLPAGAAVLVLMASPIFLSAGLHLDGFTDFCDGFFGGRGKEGILRIMKDSRIGTWGAVGLFLLLMAKFELLQDLPMRPKIFLLALSASRWSQVMFSFFLSYARPEGGLGESVAGKVSADQAVGATVFLLPVVFWVGLAGLWILAGLAAFLFLLRLFFKQKLGGVTGDVLGAGSELSELFIFLLASILVGVRHG